MTPVNVTGWRGRGTGRLLREARQGRLLIATATVTPGLDGAWRWQAEGWDFPVELSIKTGREPTRREACEQASRYLRRIVRNYTGA